jgi:hypothetical protein
VWLPNFINIFFLGFPVGKWPCFSYILRGFGSFFLYLYSQNKNFKNPSLTSIFIRISKAPVTQKASHKSPLKAPLPLSFHFQLFIIIVWSLGYNIKKHFLLLNKKLWETFLIVIYLCIKSMNKKYFPKSFL